MGFLLNMLGITTIKLVENACEGVGQLVENTREGIDQFGQVISGKLLASDIIKKSKKDCLIINIIRNPTISTPNWIKSIFIKEYRFLDYYHILDGNDNIKYKVKCKKNYTKSKVIGLYNTNDEKIGHIINNSKKNDEDIKMCSLVINDKKIINLKKYKSSNNIYSIIEQGEIKVDYNNLNAYKFKLDNNTIGKLYITRTKKSEKYI